MSLIINAYRDNLPLAAFAHFRADLGVTKNGSNLVSDWADQSGNAHNLSEATNKPLWQASQVNGIPAILFDGVNDVLASAALSLPQPYTIFLLYKEVVHSGLGKWVLTTNGPGIFMVNGAPETIIAVPGTIGAQVVPGTANFVLLTAVANGTSSTLALNNGTPQTDPDNLVGTATELRLGAGFGTFSNINVAEVVLLSGAVTPSERTAMLDYFRTVYGLW
jgi:hypothetical protein